MVAAVACCNIYSNEVMVWPIAIGLAAAIDSMVLSCNGKLLKKSSPEP